ncbi:Aste57867_18594 [Aphanomyces stellatus]|uniref:Aste57867_18594 protein n=1 Tax=Aphanomyces stellatus TaxID=120398 RepID=A0A485LAI6_9STRA|nr:hypothetical protein As57867_018532 [Aphanomyces stellatus]VFT95329.1 Aste57867_18594 [Aphanomyces stellatus]
MGRSRSRSPRRRDSRRERSSSRERSRYSSSSRRDTDAYGRDRHYGTSSSSQQQHSSSSGPPRSRYGGGGGDDSDFYAQRLAERQSIEYNIWATFPSPPSPDPVKKKKQPVPRQRSPSPASSSSSSEDETSRRRRDKKSKSKSSKSKSSKSKKRRRQRTPSPSSSSSSSSDSDQSDAAPTVSSPAASPLPPPASIDAAAPERRVVDDDDDDVIGPMPLPDTSAAAAAKSVTYGRDLLPGEGAAIAQFVQKNMRIPRRGEVGWSGNEIEQLETAGYSFVDLSYLDADVVLLCCCSYVMSGSRHQRMNAIRIRKENQVYSAEEKRALALIGLEEKQQRETTIMGEFRDMLTEKLTKKHGALVVEARQDQPDSKTD